MLRYNVSSFGSRPGPRPGSPVTVKTLESRSRGFASGASGFQGALRGKAIASSLAAHAAVGMLVLLATRAIFLSGEKPPAAIPVVFEAAPSPPGELDAQSSSPRSTFPPVGGQAPELAPSEPLLLPPEATGPLLPAPFPIPAGPRSEPAPLPPPMTTSSEAPPQPSPPKTLQARPKRSPQPSRPPGGARSTSETPLRAAIPSGPEPGPAATPSMASHSLASSSSELHREISSAWRDALGAWLQARKFYPDEARRRGNEGTVVVRFTVARDGRVLTIALIRSSGSQMLDDAAKAIFQDARLPAFTADMIQDQTTVTVPIHYRLEH